MSILNNSLILGVMTFLSLTGHAHADGRMRFEISEHFDFRSEPIFLFDFISFSKPGPEDNEALLTEIIGLVKPFALSHDDKNWLARFYFVLARNYLSATPYFKEKNDVFRMLYSNAVLFANRAIDVLRAGADSATKRNY